MVSLSNHSPKPVKCPLNNPNITLKPAESEPIHRSRSFPNALLK